MKQSEKQSALFISLIVFIILAVVAVTFFGKWTEVFVFFVLIVIIAVFYLNSKTYFLQVHEYERAVVLRRGKFRKIAEPGWHVLTPFIDSYELVDMRIKTVDISKQEVVTKDNTKLTIDGILYLKVEDPKKAVLNVENYIKSASSNIQASLRSVVGQMETSDVISNIDKINLMLKKNTKDLATEWGVQIINVEIQSIALPEGLQKSMHELKEAEQRKYAAKERAEGTRIRLGAIEDAASKFSEPTLQYMYLQSLQKIAEGKSSKIIFPMELSKIASNISEKFGSSYVKAQNEVVERYKSKKEIGESKEEIIRDLIREYGLNPIKFNLKIKKSQQKRM